ncbi:MAG: hypothetical protein C3F06_11760 [Candidatus Methanoperedenaceae archaeon]|nr:MAG: hypothetical protein C3F06_11760 [Candidatus Methanoperedenaceae archaeon]
MRDHRTGKYSVFIPSIFKEEKEDASFMERYLKIFEHILTEDEGIKEMNRFEVLQTLFHPGLIKEDFLVFLGRWMGITLKDDWDIETKREIIARIIPLYRIRGTKRGLEEYIKICTGYSVEIIEEIKTLQIGITSHVGKDTVLGGLPPHYFIVNVIIPESVDIQAKRLILKELIDQEKPLHTRYSLNIMRGIK